jgi:hypothetical protein
MAEAPLNFAQSVRERTEGTSANVFRALVEAEDAGLSNIEPNELALSIANSITGQEALPAFGLSFGERARMSFLGDTPDEKKAAFEKQFPEGEYISIPNTDITLFRRTTDDDYDVVDPSFSQAWEGGRFMVETVNDIADFAGDLPEITGEVLASVIGKGKGASVLTTGKRAFQATRGYLDDLARLFVGAGAGSQAQQAGQELAGTQQQSGMEQLEQSAQEGMFAIIGDTVGDVLGRGVNAVRGAGIVGRTPQGVAAQQAAENLGFTNLLPVESVTDNPLIKMVAKQSASVTSQIGRSLRDFQDKLLQVVQDAAKPNEVLRFTKRGYAVLKENNQKLLSMVNESLSQSGVSIDEIAPSLRQAVNDWWNISSKNTVDVLYNTARGIEEPLFDIAGLQARTAGIIERPSALGRSVDGAEPERIFAGETNSAIENVAQKIAALDPDQAVPTDFLRGLKQEIYDASLVGINGERLLDARARQLRGAIDDIMKNPLNTNPDFSAAWKEADLAAKSRFDTRELLAVSQLINTDRPVEAMRQIVRPNNFEAMAELSRVLPAEKFNEIGMAFKSQLMASPDTILKTLDGYQPRARRMLMSEEEELAIRNYASGLERLKNTGLEAALNQQATVKRQVESIMNNPNSQSVENLYRTLNNSGGRTSPFGVSMRASLMEFVINSAKRVNNQGAEEINPIALRNAMNSLDNSGMKRFLTLEDFTMLENVSQVSNVLRSTTDAGTSLRSAEVASGVVELSGSSIRELLESMTVGRVLTSDWGKRLLTGNATTRPLDLSDFRLMGAIVSTITNDIESEEQQ